MNTPLASAADLIEKARVVYASDSTIRAELDELDRSLTQPLRVALVGSVKAGKSTLLNGLLGERIAPTDARECTRIITCYHYGTTPAVTATMKSGERSEERRVGGEWSCRGAELDGGVGVMRT